MSHPDSLLDRLSHHASTSPNKIAISYLNTSGNEIPTVSSSWSFSQLNNATNYLATRLLAKDGLSTVNLLPGDRVLLVYPPCSPHFLISFLACIRAGLIAVPTYPPNPSRKDSLASFAGIASGSGAKVALTSGEFAAFKRMNEMKDAFANKFKGGGVTWPPIAWVVTDKEPLRSPPSTEMMMMSRMDLSSIAFLQYTSGSTSEPKGVSITHANLAHNLHIITNDLKASTSTVVVSWLPQYHDMGLIGSLLGVLYCGGSGYYMSPIAFLARPMCWLEAVSEYRGTHLQAPNFALGLSARKFDKDDYCFGEEKGKKRLDLTCLKHVINGAEPVTESSVEAFENAFRPFGLPAGPSVVYPTYGLAEHTVFVCSAGTGRLSVKRKELEEENKVIIVDNGGDFRDESIARLMGCGFPAAQNVDVRIVEPETRTSLDEDVVGEIWINSPSKAMGYFGKNELTKTEFHASLADSATTELHSKGSSSSISSDGYLRSGDLGFLHNGELYVCGRLKDLIIVGGRNYYPQDLETTAESVVDNIRPGCSAAFSIDVRNVEEREGEGVVLVLELKEPLPKAKKLQSTCETIASTVRSEISKEFSLALSCIIILKARSVPKTTSGKISRSRAKKAFLSGNLSEVYRSNFKSQIDDTLPLPNSSTLNKAINDTASPTPATTSIPTAPPKNVQSLDRNEIRDLLLNAISQIGNVDKSLVTDTSPLNTYMDSVSIAQLKGMLEGQYGVKSLSDEYLFRDTTTLNKLVEIVKVGNAQDDEVVSDDHVAHESAAAVPLGLGCPPGVVCCTVM